MSELLIKIDVKAPTPKMHRDAAAVYEKLRREVFDGCGFDFLAVCGDIFRPSNFVSNKDGVANRSWHKTGRAFDYDQDNKNLIIVSEIINKKQFFRTFLICAKQDGSQGEKLMLKDYRRFTKTAYFFDFTKAAERLRFERIPAWNGWERNYNRREFWHYQFNPDNLTWEQAMREIAIGESQTAKTPVRHDVLGVNDRGEKVIELQKGLNRLSFLSSREIDGVFGAKTKQAVIEFQKRNKLTADGFFGEKTRKVFNTLLKIQ